MYDILRGCNHSSSLTQANEIPRQNDVINNKMSQSYQIIVNSKLRWAVFLSWIFLMKTYFFKVIQTSHSSNRNHFLFLQIVNSHKKKLYIAS